MQVGEVAVAATLTAAPVAAAAFALLLLELHAAVNASGAITRIADNFRNIRRPQISLFLIFES
jgi:Tfp pilus assembly pilus retraction ATPase PilT